MTKTATTKMETTKMATTGRIILKPGLSHGWVMITQRSGWEMRFQTRQRALQFARAYAKLNPPVVLQVIGETGEVEAEEVFEDTLGGARQALLPWKPTIVKPA
jgi:hypothetical protein